MDANNIFMYMILGLFAFIAALMLSKPLAVILRILTRGVIGALVMFAFNFILAPWSLYVGINLLTTVYVGVLGLPGMISLYVINHIL